MTPCAARALRLALASCLAVAGCSLAGCAGGPAPSGEPAVQAASQASEGAAEEAAGTFVQDGLRFAVLEADGTSGRGRASVRGRAASSQADAAYASSADARPCVSVGTGAQPAAGQVGDGLADASATSVSVPATVEHDGVTYAVTQVAPYAFQNAALTRVTLPEGLAKVGQGAFQFCRSLTSVTFPASLEVVGSLAFFADGSLSDIGFAPDGRLSEVGDGAFAISKTPGSVENDDETATLTQVTLPASLNLLGSYAFYGQSALASVTFEGATLSSVKPGTFGRCTALESIELPTLTSTIERIGRSAFEGDVSLARVTFAGGVSGTQTTQSGNEFTGCTGIEQAIYRGKAWNANNSGMNPPSGTSAAVFGTDFSFGTGGFTDSPQAVEYYTVYQYASREEAEAAVAQAGAGWCGQGAVGHVVVTAGTRVADVVAGTCETLESEGFETGGAWAFEGDLALGGRLADSTYCYPADEHDLAACTLSLAQDAATGAEDGLPQLGASQVAGGVAVSLTAPDGRELVEGQDYTLALTCEDGTEADPVGPLAAGSYAAVATGAGAYAGTTSLSFDVADDGVSWSRLAADDAVGVAQLACRATFQNASAAEEPCTWAVVVGSAEPSDALAATALAGALGAPVVATDADGLSDAAAYEINRVGAQKVVVVGDASAVSAAAADAIGALYVVDKSYRVSGADAAELAVSALSLGPRLGAAWGDAFVVVPAGDVASAATASPYCYAKAAPLLWAGADGTLSDDALAAVAAAGMTRAVVVGGSEADACADALAKAGYAVTRVSGDTDAAVNQAFAGFAAGEGLGAGAIALASPDAAGTLGAAGVLCGREGGVLLYADDAARALASLPGDVRAAYVLGTEASVPESAADAVRAALAEGVRTAAASASAEGDAAR